MENEDDSDQEPCVPARKPKLQVNQVHFGLKHEKPMLKGEAITTFAHCSPPKSPEPVQIENTDNHPCPENENDHYDDMILDLANVEKSDNKDLHQENVKVYSFLVRISKSISQKPEFVGHFNYHKRKYYQD